jgi:uncharacterized membrane protein (UPF0127 family)
LQTSTAFLALFALSIACGPDGPVAAVHTAKGDTVQVALEVARTPAEQERGLMYRNALADGHGMLFIFDSDVDHQFWMKNTLIPLDMLFIAHDGRIVGIHSDATPLSTVQIGVGALSRYVLEVPGGWSKRHGVATGDRVELRGVGESGGS